MKTIEQLIAMANDSNVHHRTLHAAAKEVLGEDCPASRDEIIAALNAKKTEAPAPVAEPMIEVDIIRKYAPMGAYEVLEDGEWYDYEQPVPTPEKPEVINLTVAAGRTARLPKKEAARAIRAGIAQITGNTFE